MNYFPKSDFDSVRDYDDDRDPSVLQPSTSAVTDVEGMSKLSSKRASTVHPSGETTNADTSNKTLHRVDALTNSDCSLIDNVEVSEKLNSERKKFRQLLKKLQTSEDSANVEKIVGNQTEMAANPNSHSSTTDCEIVNYNNVALGPQSAVKRSKVLYQSKADANKTATTDVIDLRCDSPAVDSDLIVVDSSSHESDEQNC